MKAESPPETMAAAAAMPLDADACYRAMLARDARFDGVFFVGVSTTGVYCRPVCPARTPGRDRCQFFARAAEAERDGFRACFRCRPELAPGHAPVDAVPRLARAALARIDAGTLNEVSVDALAHELGVTGRHLRRALEASLGVTPVELAQTRRLALAKQLLQDTRLPLTEVAFASGFASVRRFNALFQERFGRAPSALRREHGATGAGTADANAGAPDAKAAPPLTLRLDYRPPLDWERLLGFLAGRAIPGAERVADGSYRRTVRLGGATGWIELTSDPRRSALKAAVSPSLSRVLLPLVARLRAVCDLDAHPAVIAEHLRQDKLLAPLVQRRPGLRVPGAFEGFELAIRAVLGQQVSVKGASTLAGRLVARFGEPLASAGAGAGAIPDGLTHTFPDAAALAAASEADVAAIGLPGARARTIVAVAAATHAGTLSLARGSDPDATIDAVKQIPGIGDWTAHYLAMRALGWPDAFPAGDLVIRKVLGGITTAAALRRAEPWRPWRAYAALHLWASLSDGEEP